MNIPPALDYNNAASWFSISAQCENGEDYNDEYHKCIDISKIQRNSPVANQTPLADVFFIHGTVLEGEGKKYLDPANPKHQKLPLYPRMAHASCFEKSSRVFQPHYRQVSLEVHFEKPEVLKQAYHVPFEDIISAYNAYMKNWNAGRPIIIAGNSQGSILALELLKYLHKNGKTPKQLIAAYIIGFSVSPNDLTESGLSLSQFFDDTRCIITYNALAQGAKQALTLLPNALCTNPLNWSTSSEYADKKLHLGRVNFHMNGSSEEIPHFTDTWIDTDTGGLIVGAYTLENAPPRPHFPKGDLHTYNYPFFYRNLEDNALARVKAYCKNK